jgi:hypothetical protein
MGDAKAADDIGAAKPVTESDGEIIDAATIRVILSTATVSRLPSK